MEAVMSSVLHRLRFSITRLFYLGARCSKPGLSKFTFDVAALRWAISCLPDGFEDRT